MNNYGLASYLLTYSTTSSPVGSVCPASSTLSIPVFNPPIPVITPINPICNNAGTLQLTATPTLGGIWANAAVAALTGVLTPSSANTAAVNTLTYTSGMNGCTASNTLTFVVAAFQTASLTGTIPNLCVNSNPFNLLSIAQNTNGDWSGFNVVPGTNLFNPGGTPAGNSSYVLTYTNSPQFPAFVTPTANLCSDSRTISVSVYNPPSPNIALAGPFCNIGGPVQLTVTPNTGTWTASPFLTQSGMFTPSLSPVGYNLVQYVIGTSTCNTQQTRSISVEAYVPAVISSTIADQCTTGSPVNLLPVTSNNLGTWSGPGVVGASFNPAVAGSGSVVLTYNTASSPSGLCPAQTTIAVNVFSLAIPFFSKVGPFCNSFPPVKLGVSPLGGLFGGANNTAVDASGLFNPAAAVLGNNIINYSITSGPCVAYAQTTISVEEFVSADFISEVGPFCRNDERLRLNMNSFVLNPGGAWDGPGMNGTSMFTFTAANIGDNNLIHYQTHSMPTATLCPDVKTIQVTIIDVPTISIRSTFYEGCAPLTVTLNAPGINTGYGTWDFGDGSEPGHDLQTGHQYTSPGTYSVVFTYSLEAGTKHSCSAISGLDKFIKVFESPRADFSFPAEDIMISSPQVQLNNTSSVLGNNHYYWHVTGPNFDRTYNELNPRVLFPQVGDYRVSLSAVSLYGCKSDVVKTLSVKTDFNVFIPNVFTPNADDKNEVFIPVFSEYGLDEKHYEMEIFDRWGSLLFSTKDRRQGWDGTVQNKGQQPLKQDVYVYKIKFRDVDGNSYSKMGHVTIIR